MTVAQQNADEGSIAARRSAARIADFVALTGCLALLCIAAGAGGAGACETRARRRTQSRGYVAAQITREFIQRVMADRRHHAAREGYGHRCKVPRPLRVGAQQAAHCRMGRSGAVADTDQARFRERKEYCGSICDQHLSRWLLGRPGLQLVLRVVIDLGRRRRSEARRLSEHSPANYQPSTRLVTQRHAWRTAG